MERTELEVVIEQLDELLTEGAVDADDALEIATLAGTAERLGADPTWLADAVQWREADGEDLLDDAFDTLDVDALVDRIDEVSCGGATDEEIEEAVLDLDDVVAAAVWCGRAADVERASARAASVIRDLPDMFEDLLPYAEQLVVLHRVASHREAYAFWFALRRALGAAA